MNPDGLKSITSKIVSFGITMTAVIVVIFLLAIIIGEGNNDVDLQSPERSEDFVRTITGLECHQMKRYILDMGYQWDKVIEYHSVKCGDFLEENLPQGEES